LAFASGPNGSYFKKQIKQKLVYRQAKLRRVRCPTHSDNKQLQVVKLEQQVTEE